MTRILVTGATTPLGAEIVKQLLGKARVTQVLAIGSEAGPRRGTHDRLQYLACHLTWPRQLRALLAGPARELDIDTIIHPLPDDGTSQLLAEAARHPAIRRCVLRRTRDVHALGMSGLVDESSLSIVVLRCAEVLAPDAGSELHDYLRSHILLRPLGFDPVINVLSVEDCARALTLAALSSATGMFDIVGAETLPLSRLLALERRRTVPVPEPLLAPLRALRALALGKPGRDDLRQFQRGDVLDGERARRELAFVAAHPIWASPVPSPRCPWN